MDFSIQDLQKNAVDGKQLASNFGEVARDCFGMDGATFASELQDRFPAASWLMNTPKSQEMRDIVERKLTATRYEDGKYLLQVPRSIWTTPPESSEGECCWPPFDFAKCAGEVPVNVLCLKDCDNIDDMIMNKVTRMSDTMAPIAYAGESIETINDRIARMSMAMHTAHTIVQGKKDLTTPMLKPFHGLAEVLYGNPAVIKIDGSNILAAFDELGCRLAVVGVARPVFMAHPLIIEAIKRAIETDQYGRRPAGWFVNDRGDIFFNGIGFIADKTIPLSTTTNTGDIWLVDGDTVGVFLATGLIPDAEFRRTGWTFDEQSCGTECRYYYNAGAAFGSDANKLAVISGVSIGDSCANGIANIPGLVVPQTLIPKA